MDSFGCVLCEALCEDGRNFPGEEKPQSEKLWKNGNSNFEFYQIESPSRATSSKSYRLLAVRVLQNLKYGEKILVDDGNKYWFKQLSVG